MARVGNVWAAVSKDYDALLFGTPRLVRFLTISGREFLPSQGAFRAITPEMIDSDQMLKALEITREQLIDLAILVGTDFNPGVKGIGPKKALALVRRHGSIDQMAEDLRVELGEAVAAIRELYLEPEVTDEYDIQPGRCDTEGILRFLCHDRAFSEQRVLAALHRAFPSAAPGP